MDVTVAKQVYHTHQKMSYTFTPIKLSFFELDLVETHGYNTAHSSGEDEWIICLDSRTLAYPNHTNLSKANIPILGCCFLQKIINISISSTRILSYEKLELRCRYLWATARVHKDTITCIDSSHLTNTLHHVRHVLERKRSAVAKHTESLEVHEKSREKAVPAIRWGLSVEGTTLASHEKVHTGTHWKRPACRNMLRLTGWFQSFCDSCTVSLPPSKQRGGEWRK